MRSVIVVALTTIAATLVFTVAPARPAAALSSFGRGDLLLDPAGGHLFATPADQLAVYDLDGTLVHVLDGETGSSELELHGRHLYVLATGGPRIDEVDADTFTVTHSWPLPSMPSPEGLAWSSGRLWFTFHEVAGEHGLASLDPSTGAVVRETFGPYAPYGPVAASHGGHELDVVSDETGQVERYDASTSPPLYLGHSEYDPNLQCHNPTELAWSVDDTQAWEACGYPYLVREYDPTTWAIPAAGYPVGFGTLAVTPSADGKLLAVGSEDFRPKAPDVFVYEIGNTTPLRSFDLGGQGAAFGGVELSANGRYLYALDAAGVLHHWDLAPTVVPVAVPVGTPTTVTITGTGLATATVATVDGTPTTITPADDGHAQVSVPALAVGAHVLEVTNRWGARTTTAHSVLVPLAPAAPTVESVGPRRVRLRWSPPDTAGGDRGSITSYVVRAYVDGGATPARTVTDLPLPTTSSVTVDGLTSDHPYRFTVAATNVAGTGPASPLSASTTPAPPFEVGPFGTVQAFVDRQYVDLIGRHPSGTERSPAVDAIATGALTPPAFVLSLRHGADGAGTVDPVVRLYRAAFLRSPDVGGFRHWVAKKRAGLRLNAMAETFTRSSEFIRRYGHLSDAAYVDQVYVNVLGRPADPSGRSFWVKRLVAKRSTRGQILTGLSESAGYRAQQAAEVDLSTLWISLFGRSISAGEDSRTLQELRDGEHLELVVSTILTSDEYAAHVSGT